MSGGEAKRRGREEGGRRRRRLGLAIDDDEGDACASRDETASSVPLPPSFARVTRLLSLFLPSSDLVCLSLGCIPFTSSFSLSFSLSLVCPLFAADFPSLHTRFLSLSSFPFLIVSACGCEGRKG